MGGRGASSGKSAAGAPYGSEYRTVYQSGNIKFVQYNGSSSAKAPMETMTSGRIYVTVDSQDKLKYITYLDKNRKRYKQIDLDHQHLVDGKKEQPHRHTGYLHNEKGDKVLSPKERKMAERVITTWANRHKLK